MLPTAAGAAGTNTADCCSPSSSPQQGPTAAFNRNITVKLPNSNRSAAARRALGDAGAVAGVGRITGSRPGSSAAFRSSRRLGGTDRESDAFSEVSCWGLQTAVGWRDVAALRAWLYGSYGSNCHTARVGYG
jgi:hypothetical protein